MLTGALAMTLRLGYSESVYFLHDLSVCNLSMNIFLKDSFQRGLVNECLWSAGIITSPLRVISIVKLYLSVQTFHPKGH